MNKESLIRASVRAMRPYVPGEQPEDGDVIKLNTNENPYPPSESVTEALRATDAAALRLYPDPLCRRLRAALAERHDCREDQVFVGNGSDEILTLATRAFVENAGVIAGFEPSYSLYPVLSEARGVAYRAVGLTDDFGWSDPPTRGISLFFLAHPNAPTGRPFERRDVEAFCVRFEGVVLIDQAYADFADDAFDDLALRLPNVLVARTFSKAFSLAGLRVGYALGSVDLIRALFALKDSYNLDGIAQRLALAAVKGAVGMRSNALRIRATRERLTEALRALGWRVPESAANFVWGRPPGADAVVVYERLRSHRILVRHFPGERTGDYLRISIGTDAEIDALLDILRRDSEV